MISIDSLYQWFNWTFAVNYDSAKMWKIILHVCPTGNVVDSKQKKLKGGVGESILRQRGTWLNSYDL